MCVNACDSECPKMINPETFMNPEKSPPKPSLSPFHKYPIVIVKLRFWKRGCPRSDNIAVGTTSGLVRGQLGTKK